VTIGRNVLLAAQVGIATARQSRTASRSRARSAWRATCDRQGCHCHSSNGHSELGGGRRLRLGVSGHLHRDWLKSSAVFRRLPELRRGCRIWKRASRSSSATRRGLGGAAYAFPPSTSRPEVPSLCDNG
jgi:hypothetical protein